MIYNVLDIANKILAKGTADAEMGGELYTNMKLQKMLYYMQGFHLAVFNEPLFEEDVEAWMYGPVVPVVYERFHEFGNKGIEATSESIIRLQPQEEQLFAKVLKVYGVYSAYGLMNLTHNEKPWKTTPVGKGNVISKEKMRIFFLTRLSK